MDEPILDLEALEALTNPAEVEALEAPLESLEGDTDILLFIGRGCPACPHQVRAVATLALASPKIAVEIVDVMAEPEMAEQYQITTVPTTVVDDELIIVGVVPAAEMVWRLMERQGPGAEKMIFAGLVHSGRHGDAAQRLADGRASEAFLELWSQSTLESRMGLFLVADEALHFGADALDALVPHLLAGLEGEGTLALDDARRGDTADLLGQIGHPDARPMLEALAKDSNEEVAEAARDALEEMKEREEGGD
jgi:glutaredoxin